MRTIHVGIVGFGTVGAGVAKLLLSQKELITARTSANINLKKIADIDVTTDRGVELPENVLTSDAEQILNDPEIEIIIETVGGDTFAKDLILKAISKGKHIVTANKALLAKHGNEIIKSALENKVTVAYEASVGGCMPVIKTIRESLVGNKIKYFLNKKPLF